MTTKPPSNEQESGGKTRDNNQWWRSQNHLTAVVELFRPSIEESLEEDGGVSSFAELHRRVQAKEGVTIPEEHLRWWLSCLGLAELFSKQRKIGLPKTYRSTQPGNTPVAAATGLDASSVADDVAGDILNETVPRPVSVNTRPLHQPTLSFMSDAAQNAAAQQQG